MKSNSGNKKELHEETRRIHEETRRKVGVGSSELGEKTSLNRRDAATQRLYGLYNFMNFMNFITLFVFSSNERIQFINRRFKLKSFIDFVIISDIKGVTVGVFCKFQAG